LPTCTRLEFKSPTNVKLLNTEYVMSRIIQFDI